MVVSVLALLCLGACNDDDADDASNGTPTSGAGGNGTTGAGTQTDAFEDTEIGHVVFTANTGEVQMAQTAQPRLTNQQAIMYAQMMVTDHTANNDELTALAAQLGITLQDNEVSQQLRADAMQIVATIQNAPDYQVDRVYIETQVAAHTEVLSIIDTQLLPEVEDASMRAFLEKTRGAVAAHLQEAEQIRDALVGTGGT